MKLYINYIVVKNVDGFLTGVIGRTWLEEATKRRPYLQLQISFLGGARSFFCWMRMHTMETLSLNALKIVFKEMTTLAF